MEGLDRSLQSQLDRLAELRARTSEQHPLGGRPGALSASFSDLSTSTGPLLAGSSLRRATSAASTSFRPATSSGSASRPAPGSPSAHLASAIHSLRSIDQSSSLLRAAPPSALESSGLSATSRAPSSVLDLSAHLSRSVLESSRDRSDSRSRGRADGPLETTLRDSLAEKADLFEELAESRRRSRQELVDRVIHRRQTEVLAGREQHAAALALFLALAAAERGWRRRRVARSFHRWRRSALRSAAREVLERGEAQRLRREDAAHALWVRRIGAALAGARARETGRRALRAWLRVADEGRARREEARRRFREVQQRLCRSTLQAWSHGVRCERGRRRAAAQMVGAARRLELRCAWGRWRGFVFDAALETREAAEAAGREAARLRRQWEDTLSLLGRRIRLQTAWRRWHTHAPILRARRVVADRAVRDEALTDGVVHTLHTIHTAHALRRAWQQWRHARRVRESLRAVLERLASRTRRQQLRVGWARWRSAVAHHAHVERSEREAQRAQNAALLARCLGTWRTALAHARHVQSIAQWAERRRNRERVGRAFAQWVSVHSLGLAGRRLANQLRARRLLRLVRDWRAAAFRARAQRLSRAAQSRVLGRADAHNQSLVVQAFRRWHATLRWRGNVRTALERLCRRQNARSVGAAFRHWRTTVVEERHSVVVASLRHTEEETLAAVAAASLRAWNLRRGLRAWRESVRARVSRRTAAVRLRARGALDRPHRALALWSSRARQRRLQRERFSLALAFAHYRATARRFAQWRSAARESWRTRVVGREWPTRVRSLQLRAVLEARALEGRVWLARVLGAWRARVRAQRADVELADRHRLEQARRGFARSLQAWKALAHTRVAQRSGAARLLALVRRHVTRRAWLRWLLTLVAQRRDRLQLAVTDPEALVRQTEHLDHQLDAAKWRIAKLERSLLRVVDAARGRARRTVEFRPLEEASDEEEDQEQEHEDDEEEQHVVGAGWGDEEASRGRRSGGRSLEAGSGRSPRRPSRGSDGSRSRSPRRGGLVATMRVVAPPVQLFQSTRTLLLRRVFAAWTRSTEVGVRRRLGWVAVGFLRRLHLRHVREHAFRQWRAFVRARRVARVAARHTIGRWRVNVLLNALRPALRRARVRELHLAWARWRAHVEHARAHDAVSLIADVARVFRAASSVGEVASAVAAAVAALLPRATTRVAVWWEDRRQGRLWTLLPRRLVDAGADGRHASLVFQLNTSGEDGSAGIRGRSRSVRDDRSLDISLATTTGSVGARGTDAEDWVRHWVPREAPSLVAHAATLARDATAPPPTGPAVSFLRSSGLAGADGVLVVDDATRDARYDPTIDWPVRDLLRGDRRVAALCVAAPTEARQGRIDLRAIVQVAVLPSEDDADEADLARDDPSASDGGSGIRRSAAATTTKAAAGRTTFDAATTARVSLVASLASTAIERLISTAEARRARASARETLRRVHTEIHETSRELSSTEADMERMRERVVALETRVLEEQRARVYAQEELATHVARTTHDAQLRDSVQGEEQRRLVDTLRQQASEAESVMALASARADAAEASLRRLRDDARAIADAIQVLLVQGRSLDPAHAERCLRASARVLDE